MPRDVVLEAYEALHSLSPSEAESRRLVDGVPGTKRKFRDVAEVIQAIYEQLHKQ